MTDVPAFPQTMDTIIDKPGMTLRDYFAGQALPALIAEAYSPEGYLDFDDVFSNAYEFADAMLEARGE